MEFKRVKSVDPMLRCGSSLWFELPEATNQKMRKLFGTGLSTEDKVKYSRSIAVQYYGFVYFFYKCYGQWRVGAHDLSRRPEVAEKIKALFKD